MDPRSSIGAGRLSALGAVTAVVLTMLGCGPAQNLAQTTHQVINVNERDFSITVRPQKVAAGTVVIRARNHGPDAHELIVVRAPSGLLPLRSDGLTVNEEALARSSVGTLEPGQAGADRELEVRLTPGRYLLLCNMAGHFMGGMHTELVVR